VNDPQHIDPELLAALLDGRLGSVEAAKVRAQLANVDDDTLAAYADAAAISADLVESNVGTPVAQRFDSAPSRRWILPSFAAMAAVLLAVVFLRQPPSKPPRFADYAASVPATAGLPQTPVWGATRGSGPVTTDNGRAVRVGALLTDLEVALNRRDTVAAVIAESMATYLGDVGGAASTAAALRAAARSDAADRDSDMRRIALEVTRFVDADLAHAGGWLEGARLAGAVGYATYARRLPASTILETIAARPDIDPAVRDALSRVISSKGADAALAAQVTTVLRDLAR
jgi:hypothetical protein